MYRIEVMRVSFMPAVIGENWRRGELAIGGAEAPNNIYQTYIYQFLM